MVQISASYRTQLLLQVSPLGLRHTTGHRQTLEEDKWKGLYQNSQVSFFNVTAVCLDNVCLYYTFVPTCIYKGRLSLRALSCCVRLWGSSSPSTMRNNSCCAFDVDSRGLQCFTMQPGHREKSVVLSYAIPIISCPVVDYIHSIFCVYSVMRLKLINFAPTNSPVCQLYSLLVLADERGFNVLQDVTNVVQGCGHHG